jgi:hypothetical protein
MLELPVEVRHLVVERVSQVEDLANLRLVSKLWQDSVDTSLIRNWVQQRPVGGQFAASLNAGVRMVYEYANGRDSFVHTFNPSFILLCLYL